MLISAVGYEIMKNSIRVIGARVHNLKNINVEIPRDKITVITGISGSGKSSLAFDTIYAEGQRRYVESLSTFARQFLTILEKPDVDQILGLSPALSIDQKSTQRSPRSTVGTITEIYDFLRLLFSRVGHPHCPACGHILAKATVEDIADELRNKNNKIVILAPLFENQKGEHRYVLESIKKAKYPLVRIDGTILEFPEILTLSLDKNKSHSIEVVIDQIDFKKPEEVKRLERSIKKALDLGKSNIKAVFSNNIEKVYSIAFTCRKCQYYLGEISPSFFSFNSPSGACPVCQGLGKKLLVEPQLVIPNQRLTLNEGAIRPWARLLSQSNWYHQSLIKLALKFNFSLDAEVKDLPVKIKNLILHGSPDGEFEGIIPNLQRRYKQTDSDYLRNEIEKYMVETICPDCHGARLRKDALNITIDDKNIIDVCQLPITNLIEFFKQLKLTEREKTIASSIIREISQRLKFLIEVGLDYLSLSRSAETLSGGEAQRIRLATQLGSALTGVIYILDEPTIGLHPCDQERLFRTLEKLKELGNTVIVVEHDRGTILSADYIIDIGPGAGRAGGKVCAIGTPLEIIKNPRSLTGQYLSGKKEIAVPAKRRKGLGKFLKIVKASQFNLKNIDVKIPLGQFVCITGVSGSGKSTLIYEILAKALSRHFFHSKEEPGAHQALLGLQNIDKAIHVDQMPIGKTPRSNPATYTGVFTQIREIFAALPEAKFKKIPPAYFSFNLKGGRCENCKGDGMIKIEMHFLPDVYVPCEICKGTRYCKEALEIYFKDKNIADVLAMTVLEAREFFKDFPQIVQKLKILNDVGLGYLPLGQPATTLSGGEAQRIKLATELARQETGKTLYILDEPTTGLHFEDINRLLVVLQRLVDKGNTVLVIEHNLDVVKSADYIIDLGPDGGEKGGTIVAEGTPEEVLKVDKSYTGNYLKERLNKAGNTIGRKNNNNKIKGQ